MEVRIKLYITLLISEKIQLDLYNPWTLEERVVQRVNLGRDGIHIHHTILVLNLVRFNIVVTSPARSSGVLLMARTL